MSGPRAGQKSERPRRKRGCRGVLKDRFPGVGEGSAGEEVSGLGMPGFGKADADGARRGPAAAMTARVTAWRQNVAARTRRRT